MSVTCRRADDFGKAMHNNEDEIIIEGDLAKKVVRIKGIGKGIWAVCIIALGAAVVFYMTAPTVAIPTGGTGTAFNLVGGTAAAGIAATALGTAVGPAIAISVAAGGVGVLNTLRDKYKIVEQDNRHIKLKRKK